MRRLKLRSRNVKSLLAVAENRLLTFDGQDIDIVFEPSAYLGNGVTDNFSGSASHIVVGIGGLYDFDIGSFPYVDDLKFVKTLVALYHEYGHYAQNYGTDKDMDCFISEVSTVCNPHYREDNQWQFPHEIRAETIGVSLAWSMLDAKFPKFSDACMLEYINDRTTHTEYALPMKKGGYVSKDEIFEAFETAMERSLIEPRPVHGGFSRYKDESVQLLTQGCSNWKTSPNAWHFDRLMDPVPGAVRDRMMASLVLAVHPELLDERPVLKSEDLSVGHVFGRPLDVPTLPAGFKPGRTESAARIIAMAEADDHGGARPDHGNGGPGGP